MSRSRVDWLKLVGWLIIAFFLALFWGGLIRWVSTGSIP